MLMMLVEMGLVRSMSAGVYGISTAAILKITLMVKDGPFSMLFSDGRIVQLVSVLSSARTRTVFK